MLDYTIQRLGDATVFHCTGRITSDSNTGLRAAITTSCATRIVLLYGAASATPAFASRFTSCRYFDTFLRQSAHDAGAALALPPKTRARQR